MTENMKKFLELVEKDEALQQKMEALKDNADETVIGSFIELAKEHGITLIEEDFVFEESNGELSDDELEAAAGGCSQCLHYLTSKLPPIYRTSDEEWMQAWDRLKQEAHEFFHEGKTLVGRSKR